MFFDQSNEAELIPASLFCFLEILWKNNKVTDKVLSLTAIIFLCCNETN